MTQTAAGQTDFVPPPAPMTACPSCGIQLGAAVLVCPNCHNLVHLRELQTASQQAQSLEHIDPVSAIAAWQQCLAHLPPDSPQAHQVRQRILMLSHAAHGSPGAARAPDSLAYSVTKTGLSMLLSTVVYALVFGDIQFAIGFVLLMLIHEMGHVIALKHYGLASGAPLFIPFMGAVIDLRSPPRNAAEEAIVGIGGPVLGTIGALACFGLSLAFPDHATMLVQVAFWGFILNLFNMLPVPPLDGGRVTAAVSPFIWAPGVLALFGMIVYDYSRGTTGVMPILILIYAAPRIWRTIVSGQRRLPYYQIPRSTSWLIGAAYLSLVVLLIAMVHLTWQTGFQF